MMKFEGVYTALVTPFRNGEVDYEALKKLVELQVAGRVSGSFRSAPPGNRRR